MRLLNGCHWRFTVRLLALTLAKKLQGLGHAVKMIMRVWFANDWLAECCPFQMILNMRNFGMDLYIKVSL